MNRILVRACGHTGCAKIEFFDGQVATDRDPRKTRQATIRTSPEKEVGPSDVMSTGYYKINAFWYLQYVAPKKRD
jgi:hypothetical protein